MTTTKVSIGSMPIETFFIPYKHIFILHIPVTWAFGHDAV